MRSGSCTTSSWGPRDIEVNRRSPLAAAGSGVDLDDLARQSADDALVAILRKLDDFRGDSRFTTWAYKFALSRRG